MTGSFATALPMTLLMLVVVASDVWVYVDARQRLRAGERVAFSVGPVRIASPEEWFVGCLVFWFVCLPLYLTATNRNPFRPRSPGRPNNR